MFNSLEQKLNAWLLSGNARIEMYETLALLLENGVVLDKAIRDLYMIESNQGKKPKATRAMMLADLKQAVASGQSLSTALVRWAPSQEVALIKAGETTGQLAEALMECSKIILAKRAVKSAVQQGTAYPILLMVVFVILLYQISTKMVPQFARTTPEENWTGAAWLLAQIAHFVTNWGVHTLVVLALFGIWVTWSLPNMYRPKLRVWLDRIPPWSIYRALHGSTFLLNVSVMLKAGVRLQDVLIIMARTGSPWVKSRIGAALAGINSGQNLGQALYRTGYEFPERRLIDFLRAVSDQDGFDEHLAKFGERWLTKSVEKVKAAFNIIFVSALVFMGGLMILVLVAVYSLQEMARTAMGM
ncbi:secretion system protein F [Pusillimonas sp. T2]|uniref:type II secretion system F family protein n=1 Tax=Pusillimonas sp. T2 TaxID=1548123 RepID=UPI000B8B53AA|nr:type II secretion system F family protein [Pusillimonas sp. T2]OXR48030.1 secretion system protein F [Pusillimonas sp. T2]